MALAWTCLIIAGLFEIGWPVGLKIAQIPGREAIGVLIVIACLAVSCMLLFLAQRQIPIGTAYAVWTGIGACGTFVVGLLAYGEPFGALRVVGATLIVGGVALLKLGH